MTGTKLGLKLVSTTPEGRMNSPVPPPFFVMPCGKEPSNRKPTRRCSPGLSGAGGVNT